jgi:ribosome-binding protein aMBF1 (putative translation factor)
MGERKIVIDAYQWSHDRYIKQDPQLIEFAKDLRVKAEVGQQIYDLRNDAGLTREQLADLVGTSAPVIEDLEEADYEGDFLLLASRIASVLHRRVEVKFVAVEDKESLGEPA